MNEIRTANIIKQLSDELADTMKELAETRDRLKAAMNDGSDWFVRWQDAQKKLDKMNAEVSNGYTL